MAELSRLTQSSLLRSFRRLMLQRPIHPSTSQPTSPCSALAQTQQRFSSQFRSSFPRKQPFTFPRTRQKRFQSTKPPNPNPTPNLNSPEPSLSLSQRLRKLSREYGWSALGVYLLLSALDFPFCFLAVRTLGTDRIGHWEHVVIENVKKVIPWDVVGKRVGEEKDIGVELERAAQGEGDMGWGVEEAEKANKESNASIWTQLALAYAIHKSFIFIRVPLTAAVTPKVVRVLRGWGWDIGKRKPKLPKKPE
ncbi:MAG: hypothetical protein M1817_006095 [Caeruleum heppii]|nr:MAG: hypothetical protein M1817_006095 [Caeruleum heppii]